MKISIILLLTLFSLAACQKGAQVLPEIISPKSVVLSTTVVASQDTMPTGAFFKIQLVKDSINNDDTVILFRKTASAGYDPNEDGLYLFGNGQVNLASILNDGRYASINTLPYTPGMSIGLEMITKSDGMFSLRLDYQKNLPANTQIWLKDTYLKDSIDVHIKTYKFIVTKADTNSYGNKRFMLTIKNKVQ